MHCTVISATRLTSIVIALHKVEVYERTKTKHKLATPDRHELSNYSLVMS